MAILITGGTGFLGSHVARHLLQEKQESDLVLFDSLPNYTRIADIQDQVTVVRGDILEPTDLLAAIRRYDVDRVIHLAVSHQRFADAIPASFIKINCIGTSNVFEVARIQGVKRVVYTSSGAVYGTRKTLAGEEVDEDVTPKPAGIYGACKLFNEHTADFYWKTFGLDVIGLRPTGVFGAGRLEKGRGWTQPGHIYDAPGLVALGQAITMPPDDQLMDWIYVADAAQSLFCALQAKEVHHRIYNMTGGRARAGEFTSLLRQRFPSAHISVSTEPVEALPLMNNERLRAGLGFHPGFTIERGMEEYLLMTESTDKPVAPTVDR